MIKDAVRRYLKGSILLSLPMVINTLIALVTWPIILKNIPVADYGKWQFVLAIQMWMLALSAPNITSAAKRGIANNMDGTFLYAFWVRMKLLVAVGLAVLGIAFYFRWSGKIVLYELTAITGLFLIFGQQFQASLSEYLVAKKRFLVLGVLNIIIFSISMGCATFIAWITHDIVYFVLFQLVSGAIISLIAWAYIVKKKNLTKSYKLGKIDRECVPFGLKMVLISLVILTSGQLSSFIIGPFWGFSSLAVFSIANKLRDKISMVIKIARPLLYADFTRLTEQELKQKVGKSLVYLGFIGLFLTLALVVMGSFYIRYFLPATFRPAIKYLIILSIMLPAGLMTIVLHSILETHLIYKKISIAVVVPNLIKILLILVFGYFMRITGVCVAIALSGWLSLLVYLLLIFNKRINVILK